MSALMRIEYNQIVELIKQLDYNEQEKLSEYLNFLTYPQWFENFKYRMSDIPVSFDEITELVEEIREERYENSH